MNWLGCNHVGLHELHLQSMLTGLPVKATIEVCGELLSSLPLVEAPSATLMDLSPLGISSTAQAY